MPTCLRPTPQELAKILAGAAPPGGADGAAGGTAADVAAARYIDLCVRDDAPW